MCSQSATDPGTVSTHERPVRRHPDEDPLSGDGMRARFLASAKRGYAPLRKAFVQKPDPKKARASVLAAMVTARQERALDAFLLLHALEPALDKDKPLPLATWAKMLSSKNNRWSAQNVGRAFEALETRHLVIRQPKGRGLLVQPQMEDGTGKAWTRPGSDATTVGKGYLVIPYDYWTSGLVDQLSMPGKAMFLIMLSETTLNQPSRWRSSGRSPGMAFPSERRSAATANSVSMRSPRARRC